MKKIVILFFVLALLACKSNSGKSMKQAIVVTSFGTTHLDTMAKTIEVCEKQAAEAFPNYSVIRAFTSNIVRKRLQEKYQMQVDSLEQALDKLVKDKVKKVIVQPLHIIPGEEYNEKIVKIAAPYQRYFTLEIGKPLLYSKEDYTQVVQTLKDEFPDLKDNQAVILMGHGTHHPANSSYSQLQEYLTGFVPRVYVGTVEAYPKLDDVLLELKKEKAVNEIIIAPFLLVAGDHAKNDMGSDEEGSWKSILESKGYQVQVRLKGLGEIDGIRQIYLDHIKWAVKSLEQR